MANDFHGIADLLADALDLAPYEIDYISQKAPLVAALPFVESSNGTTHKYAGALTHPTVGFRAENAGRDFDHSTDAVSTMTLKILDFSFMTDKAVADAWRQGGREAYIRRESARHITASLYKLEAQILLGTGDGDAAGFTGFNDLGQIDAIADDMTVNAGGTTADTAQDVYMFTAGIDMGVAGVYKGDGPAVELGETIVQNFIDGSSLNYPVYYTPGTAWFAAQLGGLISVARIVNVTDDAGKGLTDDLLAQAYSTFPVGVGPTHIVTGRRSLRQLRESRTATNPSGTPAPFPTDWEGLPIIVTDALPETSALTT